MDRVSIFSLRSLIRKKLSGLIVPLFFLVVFSGCLGKYRRDSLNRFSSVINTKQTYDAIIVPGIPFTGEKMGYLLRSRIIWSWILFKNGIAKNIIYSGGAVHTPYLEARVMGLYAQQLGIPAENIFYDTCARHTSENLFYSVQMARQKGFKKIAVASDIYQCYFLKTFISKKFDGTIDQIPLLKDSVMCYRDMDMRIDPTPALIENAEAFIPLGEKENYWERMRGTLGMKIPWSQNQSELP